ncbi:Stage V sporulation protein K [compost metagenome]
MVNGRIAAASGREEGRPSRQINIVLRNQEPPAINNAAADSGNGSVPPKNHGHSGLFQELSRELDALVGLDNIKELVFEIYALLQIAQMRSEAGLASGSQAYHMVFKGNPGTGKTTVARIVA